MEVHVLLVDTSVGALCVGVFSSKEKAQEHAKEGRWREGDIAIIPHIVDQPHGSET